MRCVEADKEKKKSLFPVLHFTRVVMFYCYSYPRPTSAPLVLSSPPVTHHDELSVLTLSYLATWTDWHFSQLGELDMDTQGHGLLRNDTSLYLYMLQLWTRLIISVCYMQSRVLTCRPGAAGDRQQLAVSCIVLRREECKCFTVTLTGQEWVRDNEVEDKEPRRASRFCSFSISLLQMYTNKDGA